VIPPTEGRGGPGRRRHPLRRFLGGAILIALLTTVAAATGGYELFSSVADVLAKGQPIISPDLAPASSGAPQTIMIVGSDARPLSKDLTDRTDPPHTDTILLVHLDPNAGDVSVMSVPRDLLVPRFTYRGHIFTDERVNFAYTAGTIYGGKTVDGDELALHVVEHALGGIKINDIIDLNFQTFLKVVAKLGCVWVDVDHRYYNPYSESLLDGYSAIDINPGYQPLCDQGALAYVRYRHDDSTFVRDARQQDFLRDAKAQLGVSGLLGHYQDIIDSLSKSISTNIRTPLEVARIADLLVNSLSGPVRQVQFPNVPIDVGGGAYQTASVSQIRSTVAEFLSPSTYASDLPPGQPSSSGGGSSTTSHGHVIHHRVTTHAPSAAGLSPTPSTTTDAALSMATGVPFKVEVPSLTYDWTAQPDGTYDYFHYSMKDTQGREVPAYRISWQDTLQVGGWYGMEGSTWTDPPLFYGADVRTYDGKTYKEVGNGHHIQDIGWIDHGVLYWISNTLLDGLTNSQMIALAESARPID
jgi:polyisoprenyl-teichoic acid--peptidoglycan teichoic acid transferase